LIFEWTWLSCQNGDRPLSRCRRVSNPLLHHSVINHSVKKSKPIRLRAHRVTVIRPLLLSLLLSAAAHGAQPDFMGTRIDREFEIKGLTIPLQVSPDSPQSLQIACGRVHLESKKLGLFRIGPMPQIVIEDMTILLPPDVDLTASAAALDAFFNANPTWSDIAIRGFQVRQMPSQAPLLQAASARIDASQGKIFFEKFLVQQTIGDKLTAPRAVLHLRGNLAGQVFRIRGRSDDSVKIFP
jgi:hypothetical protein